MLLVATFLVVLSTATSLTPPRPVCSGIAEPLIPLVCGPNAHYERCPSICSDTCPPVKCPCGLDQDCCRPRCICNNGFLRDVTTGICIDKKKCPAIPPPTTTPPTPSGRPARCRPTCAVPNPLNCRFPTYNNSTDPLECKQGYILDKPGGKCIRVEECPANLGCNGDPNAVVKEWPLPCPSTCAVPNAIPCRRPSQPLGCQCLEGFILSEHYGKCILPDKCPGGNPCGKNEVFVSCKVNCPSNYCPDKDNLRDPICETPNPCYSGCICKHNHKRKSIKDPTCILAEICPRIKCTRPNEKWFPCRPFCPRISCEEAGKYCSPPFVRTCDPRCTCLDGYFRNNSDVCVPLKQCPKPR